MKADRLIRTIEIRDRTGRVVGTKDVVTYPGLLSKAHDEGLAQVKTTLLQIPTDENHQTAIAKAVVETSKGRFEALGDANPENVNSFIVPHLIRMAETRAKARALRDAVNIGVVSFEELNGGELSPEEAEAPPSLKNRGAERTPMTAISPAASGNGAPMTEAQRRYLFRLLAGDGLTGEAAHERLKELFKVESLKNAKKTDATALIDRLVNKEKEGVASGNA
jgi:hypothetical protein